MTLSRLSLMQCQQCKSPEGGLFLCPNCGREYRHTTLPGLLLNASLAITIFSLAHARTWWIHFLDSCSVFAGGHPKLPLGKRNLTAVQPRKESLSHLK